MREDTELLTANETRSTYHIAKSAFYAKVKALGIKGNYLQGKIGAQDMLPRIQKKS